MADLEGGFAIRSFKSLLYKALTAIA